MTTTIASPSGRKVTILALALFVSVSNASAQRILTADQQQIVDTVKTLFAATQTDDTKLFNTVIARDFYLYD